MGVHFSPIRCYIVFSFPRQYLLFIGVGIKQALFILTPPPQISESLPSFNLLYPFSHGVLAGLGLAFVYFRICSVMTTTMTSPVLSIVDFFIFLFLSLVAGPGSGGGFTRSCYTIRFFTVAYHDTFLTIWVQVYMAELGDTPVFRCPFFQIRPFLSPLSSIPNLYSNLPLPPVSL